MVVVDRYRLGWFACPETPSGPFDSRPAQSFSVRQLFLYINIKLEEILMKLFTTIAMASLLAGGLQAEVVTYNANVLNGVYFGTGNSNGAFTVSTGDIEIGLRAALRQVGPITPTGNLYIAPTGTQTMPAVHTNRAAWNYEYSVDLSGSGLNLSQVTALLSITDGVTSNMPLNLQFAGNDNAFLNGGNLGFQNSENMMFGGPFAIPGYDANAADTYTLTLQVYQTQGNVLLGTDTIQVETVTPEPATFALFGLGLAGVACIRRRRKV
jgi:hypothetical protein